MENQTPRAVATERGGEAEGNSQDQSVDYTETSPPDQAEECVPLTVTAIKYPNPVGKAYGLAEGKIEKRDQLKRTSPAVGETINFSTFGDFAAWRHDLGSEYMLTSGTFDDVGEAVVVFKDTEAADQVSATKEFLAHRARPGVLIIDIDFKDADEVAKLWPHGKQPYTTLDDALEALSRVLPEADDCALMAGWSTSSNIFGPDGALLQGTGGIRIYLPVEDASLIPELLETIHKRSWLHGEGWAFVDAAARFQERSLVDLALARPTQPDFAAPDLQDDLAQDREWVVRKGGRLAAESVAALSLDEEAAFQAAVAIAREASAPAMQAKLASRVKEETAQAEKRGVEPQRARAAANSKFEKGLLLPSDTITFEGGAVVSVLDLLTDGAAYDGRTCLDPVEPDYNGGAVVGKYYWNEGAGPGVNSFAHGQSWFALKHDAESLREFFETGDDVQVVSAFAQAEFATKSERTRLEKEAARALGLGGNITSLRADVAVAEAALRQAVSERAGPTGPAWLDELNADYAVLKEDGNVSIVQFTRSQLGHEYLARMKTSAFRDFLANRFVSGRDGKPKKLADAWMAHPGRRAYTGTCMTAGEPPTGTLNLWRGFNVKPRAGDWSRMRDHIRSVICGGDEELDDYLMGWLANLVQNPFDPARVAVVLRGGKGTGKGAFAAPLQKIFGGHGFYIASSGLLAGRFNAHLEGVCFLFADEAYFAGARNDEGQLKGLITEATFALEAKGRDATLVPNRLSVLMATNSEWAVRSSNDERRYCVVDVSDTRRGDTAYFDALWAETEGDGLAAMLHDLLAYDLSGWKVQDVPQTRGLMAQKALTLEPHARWWMGVLGEGALPAWECDWEASPLEIPKSMLHRRYLEAVQSDRFAGRPKTVQLLFQWLKQVHPDMKEVRARPNSEFQGRGEPKRPRVAIFPSLDVARASFAAWMGGTIDWDEF